jgi:hypothetical protein
VARGEGDGVHPTLTRPSSARQNVAQDTRPGVLLLEGRSEDGRFLDNLGHEQRKHPLHTSP